MTRSPLNWGYLTGTAIFLGLLIVLVVAQILAKRFHPILYWATIVASTTFGTTMADFADRSLGTSRPAASIRVEPTIPPTWRRRRRIETASQNEAALARAGKLGENG